MESGFDLWRILAGLGLFLFGMHELEAALRNLAGRSFKRFLRVHTTPPIKGVVAGALSTAALQSSSVVSLIVLAFVGTGIISLASAISIVFGANLGTTATGWIVATIGFKLDLESLSLPLVAIGGAVVVWSRVDSRTAGLGHLVIGLGLMLMGLGFMKDGVANASELFDPSALRAFPPFVFLLVGFLLTAIIRSSSATMMITLSALYDGIIALESAAAVVIGADLGSTTTAVLGSLAGSQDKKRVAAAIVIFNVVTDGIAFVFLQPLLHVIESLLRISDPLYGLVAFHSLFNLIGIVVFLPFINPLSRYLEKHFLPKRALLLRYIKKQDIEVPEAALANISRETRRLIDQAAALNQISFGLPPKHTFYDSADDRRDVRIFNESALHETGYLEIKELEGELLSCALALQSSRLETSESARLSQLIPAIRNSVHSAKCIRDTHQDLKAFRESDNDHFNDFYGRFRDYVQAFYSQVEDLKSAARQGESLDVLLALKVQNESLHSGMHMDIFRRFQTGHLSKVQISTLLNVNRQIYLANQSLLLALADVLLNTEASARYSGLSAAG